MELRDYFYKHHLQNRKLLRKLLLSLTPEQVNKIPEGFNNNIIWNCAHVISVQQSLAYFLYGLPMRMEKDFVKKFTADTRPQEVHTDGFIHLTGEKLLETSAWMQEDIGLSEPSIKTPFTTAIKVDLNRMDETLSFINYHEGIHLGVVMSMIKKVS